MATVTDLDTPVGRAGCGGDFFDSHAFDTVGEVVPIDAVAIAIEEPGGITLRISHLMGGRLGFPARDFHRQ